MDVLSLILFSCVCVYACTRVQRPARKPFEPRILVLEGARGALGQPPPCTAETNQMPPVTREAEVEATRCPGSLPCTRLAVPRFPRPESPQAGLGSEGTPAPLRRELAVPASPLLNSDVPKPAPGPPPSTPGSPPPAHPPGLPQAGLGSAQPHILLQPIPTCLLSPD